MSQEKRDYFRKATVPGPFSWDILGVIVAFIRAELGVEEPIRISVRDDEGFVDGRSVADVQNRVQEPVSFARVRQHSEEQWLEASWFSASESWDIESTSTSASLASGRLTELEKRLRRLIQPLVPSEPPETLKPAAELPTPPATEEKVEAAKPQPNEVKTWWRDVSVATVGGVLTVIVLAVAATVWALFF